MRRTILIVDDDPSARTLLHEILEQEGYDVVQAESGAQGLELAQTLQVETFLLDIEMPGMNGIALCRAIRAIEKYRSTPIIFITGSEDNTVLDEAFAAGGDDFINKPYTLMAVRIRLKGHLRRAEYFQR